MKLCAFSISFICALLCGTALGDLAIAGGDEVGVELVQDSYIVTYKADAKEDARNQLEASVDDRIKKKLTRKGIGAKFNLGDYKGIVIEADVDDLDEILKSPLVASVERDRIVKANAVASPIEARTLVNQPGSTWGLGRISHRLPGFANYIYDNTAGVGVKVYVIDTGILISHSEFGGRAIWGANFIAGSPNTDQHGHGTHCAATVGGKTYGVAKRATLVAVKVLNASGSGSTAGVIQGIQWAYNNAGAARRKSVISMSLGGGFSAALNNAIASATAGGITVVVAAGNENVNVATRSPGSAPSAITVGAIDRNDRRASFSNWGPLVDIFAPGVDVKSAWIGSNTATRNLQGTSMATPHVAGLAAYFISLLNLSGSPAVTQAILSRATLNRVVDPRGSPNRIAYNGNGA